MGYDQDQRDARLILIVSFVCTISLHLPLASSFLTLEKEMFCFYLRGHILLDTPVLNKAAQPGNRDQGTGDAEDEAPPWMLPNPSDMGHTVPETG